MSLRASVAFLLLTFSPIFAQTKTAEQQFKNIQVLKGVPADQVFPTMQFISASLGVECEFCHVEGKFDSDDKGPKKTARAMITMTMGINKNHFEGHKEVTCYSCHRGAEEPSGTPPVAGDDARPARAEEKSVGNLPTPDQILEKYVAAVGGLDAIHAVKSRVEKGKINAFGHESAIELYLKAPDKRMSVSHTQSGESITAFDGKTGWLGGTGRPAREMAGSEIDAAKLDAEFYFPARVKEIFSRLRVRPGGKVGDAETYQLSGARDGQPPVRLYFDQNTGLLLRMVRYADTPVGRNPTQIDYADYRDAGGVKIPYRWTLARPGGRFTIQIEDVQSNAPIDDSKFSMPAK